jgi:cellulose synthase (UDP-forming)
MQWRAALQVFVGLTGAAAIVLMPLSLEHQVCLGTVVFVGSGALSRRRRSGPVLAFLAATATARYLAWRYTHAGLEGEGYADRAGALLLMAAETYAFVMLLLGAFQSSFILPRRSLSLPDDSSTWPSVDVFVPTYNEPLAVVRTTLLAALNMDWPSDRLRVHVLDDGGRDEVRTFAEEAGVAYLARTEHAHAKAGNLNHAFGCTDAAFVAIFDCDHVPVRAFLTATMGWLIADPRIALVQTPHHFYSPDPFERNLRLFKHLPNEGRLFYGLIQRANDLWNAAFFCGSCAVIRRSALEQVGGIAVETVTEDAHTALKLQRLGWKTAYLDVVLAAGLATESMAAHVGQRIRWARGMVQIFRIDNPFLGHGLELGQRLCYAASMLGFLSGLPRLVFLAAPIAYLVFGLHIYGALPMAALAYALPHLAQSVVASGRLQRGLRAAFWSEVYESALAWYIARPTTVALVHPGLGRFNVTAKGGRVERTRFDATIARPHLVLFAANACAIALGARRLSLGAGDEFQVVATNMLWAAANLALLGACLAACIERKQWREFPRFRLNLEAWLVRPDGSEHHGRLVDASMSGVRLMLDRTATASAGDHEELVMVAGDDSVRVPVRVVEATGRLRRLRFESVSLEQERSLVRVLFGRADAWLEDHGTVTGVAASVAALFAAPLDTARAWWRRPRVAPPAAGEPVPELSP